MNPSSVAVLGASGNSGAAITRLLLARTSAPLVLAGRDPERLRTVVNALGPAASGRVQVARADAEDSASLRAAFTGVRLVVVASSTSRWTTQVARACLEAGADCFDLVVSSSKLAELRALEPEIVRAGRCFVTDGGFHPGLPAAMVRATAPEFDRLERAIVQSVIQLDWRPLSFASSTVAEFLDEILRADMEWFHDGRWRKANWLATSDFPLMDFGPPFGRRYGAPMQLEEMRALPQMFPSLRETGFFVGGFNWFVDWLVFPLAMLALRVSPHAARAPLSALLLWGLRAFSRPPFGTVLRVEAAGTRRGTAHSVALQIAHDDGYAFTAMTVMAALEQYLDGTIARPGLWLQALAVDPARLLRDLHAMGARVEYTRTPAG